ncbi:leucine-rich repeat and coiled-coil domain-containing protein 1-like [Liolophura sinensis]|uniref:leucine-rich repeat and coiled-coil domain-containing protein 1-like n=1 Tax=Liolophura sinensis TaxID=3198878 RepID=UPI003158FE01
MYDIDLECAELCLIDSGIKSLRDIPLGRQLCVLNLHNNSIPRIEGLDALCNLKHLDLSSNRIEKIEGLGGLHSLRTLNLSCNRLKVVEGLQNLRCLVKLNLSYNQIEDVSGFASLWGNGYKLSHIEIHGNYVQSVNRFIETLTGCVNVQCLIVRQGPSSNPLCNQPDYRERVLRGLPQLQVLDGLTRDGQQARSSDAVDNIPGENWDHLHKGIVSLS